MEDVVVEKHRGRKNGRAEASGKRERFGRLGVWFVLWVAGAWVASGGEAWSADEDGVPKTTSFSLSGYFRFRGDVFHNPGMGVAPRTDAEIDPTTNPRRSRFGRFPFYHPAAAYPLSEASLGQSYNNDNLPRWLSYGNMRLRVLGTLNVSEYVQIHSTLDFLDNVVLGSTPRGNAGLLTDPLMPLQGLSDTQVPPTYGANGFTDAIRVRHIFASIQLPFGTLVAGRMPNEWGLGIMANSGMKLNSEWGDTVDRVAYILPLFGHLIIPSYEFMSSGPTSAAPNQWWGQPFDLEQGDTVHQVTLRAGKIDRGQELRKKLDNGDLVVNYGIYFSYRWQQLSSECRPGSTCTGGALNGVGLAPNQIELRSRGLSLFIPDAWFRLQLGNQMRIEFEWSMMIGTIERGPDGNPIDILQWGGAFEFEYTLLNGQLKIGFDAGIASGDRDFTSRWGRAALDTDASISADKRGKINNFLFDPDYQIDMILWRELFGTFTNGFYIRPHITYNVYGDAWKDDGFGLRLAGIFSGALVPEATLGADPLLGVELNAMARYASSDGYSIVLAYGVLFPLAGMSFAEVDSTGRRLEDKVIGAGIAQRIQVRVNVRF